MKFAQKNSASLEQNRDHKTERLSLVSPAYIHYTRSLRKQRRLSRSRLIIPISLSRSSCRLKNLCSSFVFFSLNLDDQRIIFFFPFNLSMLFYFFLGVIWTGFWLRSVLVYIYRLNACVHGCSCVFLRFLLAF